MEFKKIAILAVSVVAGASIAWVGFRFYQKRQANATVATLRGVSITRRMQVANRIFRQAFRDPMTEQSPSQQQLADNLAHDYICMALDEYRQNPQASYPLLLLGKLEAFHGLAGGPATPEMQEAARRLRSMHFEEALIR